MPHRTVFQWGKNPAHPFTVFIGGFIIGALVTGAIMYAWGVADGMNNSDSTEVIIQQPIKTKSPTPAVTPSASPTAKSQVQF